MKSLLIITFTFFYTISFSQTSDSLKIDTTFSYEAKIPSWLHQLKTESTNLFGGTLPAVNGIENAIVIESFKKTELMTSNLYFLLATLLESLQNLIVTKFGMGKMNYLK
jgi:hypothetical protein